ncbi:MAG: double-strand break repair helicase AddA [Pseudomonadota bacterium]|jgi:ATP-dependent helicase/nuclease subunit A
MSRVDTHQGRAADPALSVVVTANAGSGKTKTLVDRVARLLLQGARPQAILCVTYTKAAAAEMQRRLFEQLGAWAVAEDEGLRASLATLENREPESLDGERLSTARKLFARALETPGGLKIQTLHAFCERLLRQFPVEAGVSPEFRLLDDTATREAEARARERLAKWALEGTPVLAEAYARQAVALHNDAFGGQLKGFLSDRQGVLAHIAACGGLAGLPEATARSVGLERLEDAEALERAAVTPPALDVEAYVLATGRLEGLTKATDTDQLARIRGIIAELRAGRAPLGLLRELVLNKDGGPRARLVTKDAPAAVAEFLAKEQERLLAVLARAKAARVAAATVDALVLAWFAIRAYAEVKAELDALDFADLTDKARALLSDRPSAAWVLYKLDGGIDHILVDEAQDTAPEQWDMVEALTEEFFSGAGAGLRAQPRTLFIVGDEKQSIYSFQGAAPHLLLAQSQRYDTVVRGAGQVFEQVDLLMSWRSSPVVLAFVDQVFAGPDAASALKPGGQADTVRHLAALLEAPGTVDLWPLEEEEEREEREAWIEPLDVNVRRGANRRLAERIARQVKAMVQAGEAVHDKKTRQARPMTYGDVLILVRKRGALFEETLRALKSADIPVAGADRLKLASHPAFLDLQALGRFVLHPWDDLTLAALLRSPFCSVTEEELFHLAHGRKGNLWSELNRRGDERASWAEARTFLGIARSEAEGRSPFDAFNRMLNWRDRRGLTQFRRLTTRLGAESAEVVEEFLNLALAAEARGVADLERFAVTLEGLEVEIKRELDEPKGEVRVMTVHGAKGLEAPVVILPDTVESKGARGSALLAATDGGRLWSPSKAFDCEASAAVRAEIEAKADEESLRLLYVALTRARDRLILAGRRPANTKTVKGWRPLLEAAFARLGADDETRAVETSEGPILRYGAEPVALGPAAPLGRVAETTPIWLDRQAPVEPAASAYASPSTLADQKRGPAPSPLAAAAGGLGRFRRGELIHRLLQLLPDLPPEARHSAAERWLAREKDLSPEQRREMIGAAFGVLDDARFAAVFGPGSRAEAAVAGTSPEFPPGLAISGRVDRMLVSEEKILVVDFKTNRPAPDRIDNADPAYLTQMALYVAALRVVFPDRPVEGALVWTDGPKLMPVPEEVVRSRLTALRRAC